MKYPTKEMIIAIIKCRSVFHMEKSRFFFQLNDQRN